MEGQEFSVSPRLLLDLPIESEGPISTGMPGGNKLEFPCAIADYTFRPAVSNTGSLSLLSSDCMENKEGNSNI